MHNDGNLGNSNLGNSNLEVQKDGNLNLNRQHNQSLKRNDLGNPVELRTPKQDLGLRESGSDYSDSDSDLNFNRQHQKPTSQPDLGSTMQRRTLNGNLGNLNLNRLHNQSLYQNDLGDPVELRTPKQDLEHSRLRESGSDYSDSDSGLNFNRQHQIPTSQSDLGNTVKGNLGYLNLNRQKGINNQHYLGHIVQRKTLKRNLGPSSLRGSEDNNGLNKRLGDYTVNKNPSRTLNREQEKGSQLEKPKHLVQRNRIFPPELEHWL